jgi:hypothetical protein
MRYSRLHSFDSIDRLRAISAAAFMGAFIYLLSTGIKVVCKTLAFQYLYYQR